MDELETASRAGCMAHELREFADFIEQHPKIAEDRSLLDAIAGAEQAMHELDMIEFAEADDFEG